MKIRTRILLGLLLLYVIGFYFIVDMVKNEIRPRYLEAVEESMNDTAHIIASLLESDIKKEAMDFSSLRTVFTRLARKRISATIYDLHKTDINLSVYVTDDRGIVVYDSDGGRKEGEDYSRWNDVYLTLQGKYGARSSRAVESDPSTNSLYVAAPVKRDGRLAGVITVVKPEQSVTLFIELAKRKVIIAGIVSCAAFIMITVVLSFWIDRPVKKLIRYVRTPGTGPSGPVPKFRFSEIRDIAMAYDDMRRRLEGKSYVEEYIHSLTHELKSPLSAIRGSAELLSEEMPQEKRTKFHQTIVKESKRIEDIIEHLLQLSALENRKGLSNPVETNIGEILAEVTGMLKPQIDGKGLSLEIKLEKPVVVFGETFLITHAVLNLLKNAVQFSPRGGAITVAAETHENFAIISITDRGDGVPGYALDKIFKKFYSLPGKETLEKGSGLGLPFVREVAYLHGGWVEVVNTPGGGVTATLALPHKKIISQN